MSTKFCNWILFSLIKQKPKYPLASLNEKISYKRSIWFIAFFCLDHRHRGNLQPISLLIIPPINLESLLEVSFKCKKAAFYWSCIVFVNQFQIKNAGRSHRRYQSPEWVIHWSPLCQGPWHEFGDVRNTHSIQFRGYRQLAFLIFLNPKFPDWLYILSFLLQTCSFLLWCPLSCINWLNGTSYNHTTTNILFSNCIWKFEWIEYISKKNINCKN